MTQNGQDYTYQFCDTEQLEDYFYTVCGDLDGETTCKTYSFLVTGDGKDKNTGMSLLASMFLWGIILVAIYFVLIREKEERNIGHENLGWFFTLLTFVVGIGIIEGGENVLVFIFGSFGIIVSLHKLIQNMMDDG